MFLLGQRLLRFGFNSLEAGSRYGPPLYEKAF
jgi:hypothetical protein